jgi:hypothetical protein
MRTRSTSNLRLVYFARNLARLAIPGRILRARLAPELARLGGAELELAVSRADYCLRVRGAFDPGPDADRWRWSLFQQQRNYAFDLVEHLRWFDPRARVAFRFGDDTRVPAVPTLVKARPIEGDVNNAVLFPLNKVRHFRFVRDRLRFADKEDRVVWRGKAHQPHRLAMLAALERDAWCDAGRTNDPDGGGRFVAPYLSVAGHLRAKFVLSVEGNDVATNLKWILSSNSLCLMRRPRLETWFQEGLLRPGVHYVEVADDWSDVGAQARWHAAHPEVAERITRAANAHCARFQVPRVERATALIVLARYLVQSGQLAPDGLERVLAAPDDSPGPARSARSIGRE